MRKEFDIDVLRHGLQPGLKVVTRDGRDVSQLSYYDCCDVSERANCISGIVPDGQGQGYRLIRWSRRGRANTYHPRGEDSRLDLFIDDREAAEGALKARIAYLESELRAKA